jgi:light-regulated signal transduction histidine kinase (bacteriophytochrome)
VLSDLEPVIEETGAEVTCPDLPVVRGESSLLSVLVRNLLSNAIKFRGEEPPRVRIDVSCVAGEWEFAVSDNGIGIEDEYAERIFVIFQRLHPRSAYPGTGIGLALTRKIVEYHGGRIWLDTSPAEPGTARTGTTFRFTLPQNSDTP